MLLEEIPAIRLAIKQAVFIITRCSIKCKKSLLRYRYHHLIFGEFPGWKKHPFQASVQPERRALWALRWSEPAGQGWWIPAQAPSPSSPGSVMLSYFDLTWGGNSAIKQKMVFPIALLFKALFSLERELIKKREGTYGKRGKGRHRQIFPWSVKVLTEFGKRFSNTWQHLVVCSTGTSLIFCWQHCPL